jgi:hypothetical protein
MLRKVFLLIIKYVLWFTSMNLFNHWLEQTFLFWFENEGAQLFLIWVIFWILILKLSWVFRGKIDVSLENNSWLPNSAQPARSAQTVENSHSFFNVSYTWYKFLRLWIIRNTGLKFGPVSIMHIDLQELLTPRGSLCNHSWFLLIFMQIYRCILRA